MIDYAQEHDSTWAEELFEVTKKDQQRWSIQSFLSRNLKRNHSICPSPCNWNPNTCNGRVNRNQSNKSENYLTGTTISTRQASIGLSHISLLGYPHEFLLHCHSTWITSRWNNHRRRSIMFGLKRRLNKRSSTSARPPLVTSDAALSNPLFIACHSRSLACLCGLSEAASIAGLHCHLSSEFPRSSCTRVRWLETF